MFAQIMRKLFRLPDPVCDTCEVLKEQLAIERQLNKVMMEKLTATPVQQVETVSNEELKPITPQFVPWRLKQQMLEAEDRRAAQLMKDRQREISELEKEMGIDHASKEREAI